MINKKQPLVSILMLSMNGESNLKICLPSLRKENYKNKEVILVDNASSDQSITVARKLYPGIKIIANKKNNGFAGGNNQAFEKSKGKYLFLLNDDTKIPSNMFGPLVEYMEKNPLVGACQPRVLRMDDPLKLDSVGSYFTNTGFLYHYGFGKKDTEKFKKEIKLFSAKGSALMLRAELIKKIGLFDDDYFAYFEETDLCWRIWLSGYFVVYVPESYILHKGWGTIGKMYFPFFNFHSYKNRIASLIRNLEIQKLFYILPIHLALCIFAAVAYVFTGKFATGISIIKSINWNLVNMKKNIKKRKIVQNEIRKVPDSEFLNFLTKKITLSYFYYLFTGLEKYNKVVK